MNKDKVPFGGDNNAAPPLALNHQTFLRHNLAPDGLSTNGIPLVGTQSHLNPEAAHPQVGAEYIVTDGSVEEALRSMELLATTHPYIAVYGVGTGSVARPITYLDYAYRSLKANVDLSAILALGYAFFDVRGRYGGSYQFNFKMSRNRHGCLETAIQNLTNNGYDLRAHEQFGIDFAEFGRLYSTSTLSFNPEVHYLVYHGSYELALIVKGLLGDLPLSSDLFIKDLEVCLPSFYDMRYMLTINKDMYKFGSYQGQSYVAGVVREPKDANTPELKGFAKIQQQQQQQQEARQLRYVSPTLTEACMILNVAAPTGQAGEIARQVGRLFFQSIRTVFNNYLDDDVCANKLWGIGPEFDECGAIINAEKTMELLRSRRAEILETLMGGETLPKGMLRPPASTANQSQ